jgi:hypothetical protein
MSSFWSTIIGAAAAIAGGLGAAMWQSRRADDIARRVRRQERREQALLALYNKIQAIRDQLLSTAPKEGISRARYNAVAQAVGELIQLWDQDWSAAIPDSPIRVAFEPFSDRRIELLKAASQAKQYPESEPDASAETFLGHTRELLGLVNALADEVEAAVRVILHTK